MPRQAAIEAVRLARARFAPMMNALTGTAEVRERLRQAEHTPPLWTCGHVAYFYENNFLDILSAPKPRVDGGLAGLAGLAGAAGAASTAAGFAAAAESTTVDDFAAGMTVIAGSRGGEFFNGEPRKLLFDSMVVSRAERVDTTLWADPATSDVPAYADAVYSDMVRYLESCETDTAGHLHPVDTYVVGHTRPPTSPPPPPPSPPPPPPSPSSLS